MGYILELEPYCDGCPEFNVQAKTDEYWFEDYMKERVAERRVHITCSHQKRCENMIKWLDKKQKEERSNDGRTTDRES